ncbi:hypothetical protein PG993_007623 [Apiospora rasikravindrae]|uniref:Survival motor neuron Tudor domain-containing protein n=1 Tax=Apiospora rasikravindrae TaxID=990691 RepID=A0ABR1SY13_9PEZI
MASNQQNLPHDEVWDDSALVDSWNDALDEYKVLCGFVKVIKYVADCIQKYHSIYRHGGNVDDLLKETEKDNVASDAKLQRDDSELLQSSSVAEQAQVKDDENTRVSCDRFSGMEVPAKIRKAWHDNVSDILEKNGNEAAQTAQTAQPSATSTSRPEGIPAPLLGSGPPDSQSANPALVQDEGLKKLMMSWYYAGYYTGLYEGQKQQSQQQ